MSEMTSEQRREFLSDIVGKDNSKDVNALFESKLLLKNFQQGAITWAKSVAGMRSAVKRDLISRIEKMDTILNPATEKEFLHDLAEKRLGVGVDLSEAKQITELSKAVQDARTAMESGGDRMEYGRALDSLNEYVSDLKNDAKRTRLSDFQGISTKQKLALGGKTLLKGIVAAPGVSKSIAASMDASAILRQGFKTMSAHPTIWAKNSVRSIKDLIGTFGGKAVMHELNADLLSRENAQNGYYKKAKLDVGSTEEAFPTSLPEKVPYLGRAFKASENAYTIFTHKTRADVFDHYVDVAKKNGVEMTDTELTNIGRLVNSLVGRGYLGKASGGADAVNVLFFSPRAIKGHIDTITQPFTGGASVREMATGDNTGSAFVRKQAAKNLVKNVATVAAIMAIAKAVAPDSVELDPRSSDFGKIKYRGTRFDITGGMGSLAVLAARQLSGKTKSTTSGKMSSLSNPEYGQDNRMDSLVNFFENKFSPIAGVGRDFYKGKDFDGNPMHFDDSKSYARAGLNLITPLPIKTGIETWGNPNVAPLLAALIADGLGSSVNSYNSVASIKHDIEVANKRGDTKEADRLTAILPLFMAKEQQRKLEEKERLKETRKDLKETSEETPPEQNTPMKRTTRKPR